MWARWRRFSGVRGAHAGSHTISEDSLGPSLKTAPTPSPRALKLDLGLVPGHLRLSLILHGRWRHFEVEGLRTCRARRLRLRPLESVCGLGVVELGRPLQDPDDARAGLA
eukprot:6783043-Alexandrium_andersonii.AAC.1